MKVKTVTLTGEETKIEFDRAYAFVEVNNPNKTEILVSVNAGIVRGNDDVLNISAKTIATIGDTGSPGIKEIYALGEGEIQMIAKNYAEHCFKDPASGDNADGDVDYGDFYANAIYDATSIDIENGIWHNAKAPDDPRYDFVVNDPLNIQNISIYDNSVLFSNTGSNYMKLPITEEDQLAIPQFMTVLCSAELSDTYSLTFILGTTNETNIYDNNIRIVSNNDGIGAESYNNDAVYFSNDSFYNIGYACGDGGKGLEFLTIDGQFIGKKASRVLTTAKYLAIGGNRPYCNFKIKALLIDFSDFTAEKFLQNRQDALLLNKKYLDNKGR